MYKPWLGLGSARWLMVIWWSGPPCTEIVKGSHCQHAQWHDITCQHAQPCNPAHSWSGYGHGVATWGVSSERIGYMVLDAFPSGPILCTCNFFVVVVFLFFCVIDQAISSKLFPEYAKANRFSFCVKRRNLPTGLLPYSSRILVRGLVCAMSNGHYITLSAIDSLLGAHDDGVWQQGIKTHRICCNFLNFGNQTQHTGQC